MSLLFGIAIALKIIRARSGMSMSSLFSGLGENIIKKFFWQVSANGKRWKMDKMMDKYAYKARSEVQTPQILNGLVISILVYWALWVSSSLVIRLIG
jgi:hypothetical protein